MAQIPAGKEVVVENVMKRSGAAQEDVIAALEGRNWHAGKAIRLLKDQKSRDLEATQSLLEKTAKIDYLKDAPEGGVLKGHDYSLKDSNDRDEHGDLEAVKHAFLNWDSDGNGVIS